MRRYSMSSLVASAGLICAWSASGGAANAGGLPQLSTNQQYLEEVMRPPSIDIADLKAVFDFVLASLPLRVKVYPTENYYYFNFMHAHVRYAGNLRFDVKDRDDGQVHFAYFEDLAEWKDEAPVTHRIMGKMDGVEVEKMGTLVYRVTSGSRSVVFELNDLSGVKPPPGLITAEERFIGPIFDESGIRFLLVYNRRLKIFHYLLDETTTVAEQFTPMRTADRILIGKRTGFAFYRDHRIDRKILIGVFEGNSRVNNHFDGPFDQLPDNFIEGEDLRSAITAIEPRLKGRIDRLGISPGGADRYMISPYRHYRLEEDLAVFDECAKGKDVPAELYYGCFVFVEEPPPATASETARSRIPKMRTKHPASPNRTAPPGAKRPN